MPMLDMDGCGLYYTVKGEGIPIVFIHPPLLTSANFNYQMEELSTSCQVIAFDIRGHGRSQYSHQAITYQLIAEDMKRLLDHLGIKKVFICGYSTGGSILLEFLLTYTEYAFGGIVVSGMSEVNDLYLKQRISIAEKLANDKTMPILVSAITWGNADTQETYRKLRAEVENGQAANIEQYYRYSLEYNCTDRLQEIDHPILLVYGSKDESFHHYANLLHEKLPQNELRFIENEKHQLPTKAAGRLNEMIIEFIQAQKKADFC